MKEKKHILEKPEKKSMESIDSGKCSFLVLYNDEIHTFEYVIESLIEVCNHDEIQAEQCTMIVHYKGQCEVKKGLPDSLIPLRDGLISRGLKASID